MIKKNFLKWFITDIGSVLSFLFALGITIWGLTFVYDDSIAKNHVIAFFVAVWLVIVIKVWQSYNDYLKGKSR
jgi:hypothetical protein